MTDLLRKSNVSVRIESPVTVRITRPRSPHYGRCSPGLECVRQQAAEPGADGKSRRRHARTKSVEGRGQLRQQNTLLLPSSSSRSRSCESLTVPSQSTKRGNLATTDMESNSPSSSPFDWIERERLPSGSPTFEKVLCEMLSESEISPRNSDTEIVKTITVSNQKRNKKYIKTRPQKTMLTVNRNKTKL